MKSFQVYDLFINYFVNIYVAGGGWFKTLIQNNSRTKKYVSHNLECIAEKRFNISEINISLNMHCLA